LKKTWQKRFVLFEKQSRSAGIYHSFVCPAAASSVEHLTFMLHFRSLSPT